MGPVRMDSSKWNIPIRDSISRAEYHSSSKSTLHFCNRAILPFPPLCFQVWDLPLLCRLDYHHDNFCLSFPTGNQGCSYWGDDILMGKTLVLEENCPHKFRVQWEYSIVSSKQSISDNPKNKYTMYLVPVIKSLSMRIMIDQADFVDYPMYKLDCCHLTEPQILVTLWYLAVGTIEKEFQLREQKYIAWNLGDSSCTSVGSIKFLAIPYIQQFNRTNYSSTGNQNTWSNQQSLKSSTPQNSSIIDLRTNKYSYL